MDSDYDDLWKVITARFVISHGQASVERGFSVNGDMVPNMKRETLVAQRVVYDAIESLDIKVHEFEIDDKLLKSCSQAYGRYKLKLMEDRSKVQKDKDKSAKRTF